MTRRSVKTIAEQLEPIVEKAEGLVTAPEAEIEEDQVLELDGPPASPSFGFSVDLLDFDDQAFIHHGLAQDMEMAVAMADEVELKAGQMVRVTPVSYFRVKHD